MRRFTFGAAMIAVSLAAAACSKDQPTQPTDTLVDTSAVAANDYSLVVFGSSGAALEGTLGPAGAPFDGRSGFPPFPDSIALSDAQKAQMQALRDAFRTAHQSDLDALKAIFDQARAAHDAGATRDSVRTILQQARAIQQSLQAAVDALHQGILAVLTDAQRAWLAAHRPPPPPNLDGHPGMGPPDRRGGGGPPPNR